MKNPNLKEGSYALCYSNEDTFWTTGISIGSLVQVTDVNTCLGLYCVHEPGMDAVVLEDQDIVLVPVDNSRDEDWLPDISLNEEECCVQLSNGSKWFFYDIAEGTYRVTKYGDPVKWSDRFVEEGFPMTTANIASIARRELDMMVMQAERMSAACAEMIAEDFFEKTALYFFNEDNRIERKFNSFCIDISYTYDVGSDDCESLWMTVLNDLDFEESMYILMKYKDKTEKVRTSSIRELSFRIADLLLRAGCVCSPGRIPFENVPSLEYKHEKKLIAEKLFRKHQEEIVFPVMTCFPNFQNISLDSIIRDLVLKIDSNHVYHNTFSALDDEEIRLLIRLGIVHLKADDIVDYRKHLKALERFFKKPPCQSWRNY